MHPDTVRLHQQLVEAIRFLHAQGWAPATSSNYSLRLPGDERFWVSASGIDKGTFEASHLMHVDPDGRPIQDSRRPSAETLIHSLLYRRFPEAQCILHTHSVHNTLLSLAHAPEGVLTLEGYEVLKGLQGIQTHLATVPVPILPNTQDMEMFCTWLDACIQDNPGIKGFLIQGHGLYTWATGIAEAKRHVEVFEFLFEIIYKLRVYTR